jgi:hypothetical protein
MTKLEKLKADLDAAREDRAAADALADYYADYYAYQKELKKQREKTS